MDGLENDRIGRLGEIEFSRLCEIARLSCSKVEPDRTGKDFIIEFPPPALQHGQSFDRRDAPLQFAVQVKTIKKQNQSVKLALSVAERLARDLRPTLICILRIDQNDQFVGLHLVHLIGDALGRVLTRLRKATTSAAPLHKLSMTFPANSANAVEHKPAALLSALSALIPSTMENYFRDKASQIENMGYGEDRIHGTIRIKSLPVEDLASGMLGLIPFEGATMELLERRFNIDLPMFPEFDNGQIMITPEPSGKVLLNLTDLDQLKDVTFECDIFVPPYEIFENGGKKMMFSWPMGRLVVSSEIDGECDFTEKFNSTDRRPAEEWLVALKASEIIRGGNAKLSASLTDGRHLVDGKLVMDSPIRVYGRTIHLLENLLKLRSSASAGDQPVSLAALIEQTRTVSEISALLEGNNEVNFSLLAYDENTTIENQDGLYVCAARLGESQVFGIAVPMAFRFTRDASGFHGVGFIAPNAGTIELLNEPIHENYSNFTSRVSKLTKLRLRIVDKIPDRRPDSTDIIVDTYPSSSKNVEETEQS